MDFLSFTIARVAGAVVSALAAVLSPSFHLSSIKVHFLGCNAHNKSLGWGRLAKAHVRVHLASSTAAAALAAGATATVSSTARHSRISD